MTLADIQLSRRIERAEGLAGAACVRARQLLQPEAASLCVELAGTMALFDGPSSPITQTFGLGLNGPVTSADLTGIEDFFFTRNAPVQHEISPMADPSLWPLLSQRGYTPIEFTSLLYLDLNAFPPEPRPHPGLLVKPVAIDENETFIQVNLSGWSDFPGASEVLGDLMRVLSATPGLRPMLVWADGEPVAAGSLNILGDVALFAGACTIPSARGRGAQRALLDERLGLALSSGCSIAVMGAHSGSGSQRNAERSGFRIAYTRTKWRLDVPSGPGRGYNRREGA